MAQKRERLTHQIGLRHGVSKSNHHYGEEIGARIRENAHGQCDHDTCVPVDRLELADSLGPNPLFATIVHGLELHSLLCHCLLRWSEEISTRDIFGKDEIGDYGDQASHTTFEDEKIRPNKEIAGRFDLEHSKSEQSTKCRGDDSTGIEDGNS